MSDAAVASGIFARYLSRYDGEVQGCCPVIADEIRKRIGGCAVAGMLLWYGGCCRRTHWWVEKDGVVIDPMGDWFLSDEEGTGREVVHRNQSEFEAILPQYERWRIAT